MVKPNQNLLAAILLSIFCVNAVSAMSIYEKAMEKYRAGLYQQAANDFSEATQHEPSKQIYHYLLANCLVHLDEHARAAEEYRLAYLLEPSSSTGDLCRQALSAYKKPVPEQAAQNLSRVRAADSLELDKVKALIRKQANFEKDKHDLSSVRSERNIKASVDEELRRIDQWMQTEIQKLNDPIDYHPTPHPNRLLRLPELLKENEDEIRATAKAEKEQILKKANERAQVYESLRKGREALLDETAGNLQSQLDQPAGPSGVKLQAHGTGLYVRYYGAAGTSKLPETHQATARIQDAASVEPVAADQQQSSGKFLGDTAKDVKGKVVKDSSPTSSFSQKTTL